MSKSRKESRTLTVLFYVAVLGCAGGVVALWVFLIHWVSACLGKCI